MGDVVQDLMQTPLGDVLSASEASELCKNAKQRSIGRGQYLFRTGEQGNALYIVLSGALDVVLGKKETGETVVATVSPGQIVGELEVMTASLRVASLVSTEETTLLELSATQLEDLMKNNRPGAAKLVFVVAKTLARRLAAVNQRIMARSAPPPPSQVEPVELDDTDVLPAEIKDEDLDVLDKLWS